MLFRLINLLLLINFIIAGCSSPKRNELIPDLTISLNNKTVKQHSDSGELQKNIRKARQLNLYQAQILAMMNHPQLKAFAQEIFAKHSAQIQAGFWKNPRVKMEIENVASSMGGLNGAEGTIALSQELPVNGVLGFSIEIAKKDTKKAQELYKEKQLELLSDVYLAFYSKILANKRYNKLKEFYQNAQDFYNKVSLAVKQGAKPEIDLLKAQITLSNAFMHQKKASNNLKIADKELSLLICLSERSLPECKAKLLTELSLPSLDKLKNKLNNNPKLKKLHLEYEQLKLKQNRAKSERLPNIEAEIGFRRDYNENENSLLFAVQLPLPLFDRKQGKIQQMQDLLEKNIYQKQVIVKELRKYLFSAYWQYKNAYNQAKQYQNKILPSTNKALKISQKGYQEGKLQILQVIHAHQTQIQSYLDFLDTLENLHEATARLLELIPNLMK